MGADHSKLYKSKGIEHQAKRRNEILQIQKSQREDLLDEYRKIVDKQFEYGKHAKFNRRHYDIADMLMLSEWLLQIPEDCELSWKFIVCPEGRRCLLLAKNGMTVAVSKKGKEFGRWETPLPGGNANQPGVTTILDCVFSDAKQCYYVLDILHWADIPFVGTEMNCRQFWIQSRLRDELPELRDLRRPIVPLVAYPCTAETIADVLAKFPYFDGNVPKVDGVLFYHQDALYTQGNTPLVGWLKPFMIPEVFGATVAPNYYDDRPRDYAGYLDFIKEFDEQYWKKRSRRKKSHDCEMNDLVDVELERG